MHWNDSPFIAILDTKPLISGSLPPEECARPGLHQFLEAIYPYYDSGFMYIYLHYCYLNEKSSLYMVPGSSNWENNFVSLMSSIEHQVPNQLGLARNQT